MAQICDFCGKKPIYGNRVSHANNKRRRRWIPNLKSLRADVKGVVTRLKLCTRCIRSEKAKKVTKTARGLNKPPGWTKKTQPQVQTR